MVGKPLGQRIKEKVFFWKDYYPTKAVIFRRRSEEAVPVFTNAVRMIYDELPNMHEIETGEETSAVPLEAVSNVLEQDKPVYIFEDENGGEYVARKVDDGIEPTFTGGGSPCIFLAEPEDGDLVPINFAFRERNKQAENIMDILKSHVEPGEDIPEEVMNKINEEIFELADEGFTPDLDKYLIENKDERLSALAKHLANRLEKYVPEGWLAKLAEHKELLLVVGTGIALSAMFYVFASGEISEMLPMVKELNNMLPDFMEKFAGMGGSPPGG